MSAVAELVREVEATGIRLAVEGENVVVAGPASLPRKAAEPLLVRLRERRAEVLDLLRRRTVPPPMPHGIRLLNWLLLPPPIALNVCSIVTEPERFAGVELELLAAKLANPQRWTGRTIDQHIKRLRAVGVIVEIEE